jgi:GAF domain-containing protein/HAMP domain-containing protein
MPRMNNLKFGTKILLFGISSVLLTVLVLVATVVWQSGQFNALAQDQFRQSAEADLAHIAEGAYNVVEAQDQVVQEQANSGLNVAQQLIHDAGGAKLADEKIDWQAANDATQQMMNIQLPKMYVGNTWLGKMTGRYDTTPIIDHAQILVGGNATIFQRMNEEGDMLRVATNVLLPDGQRAIGTYVPATNPDGTPNPAIAAVLRNSGFRGSNFIVDAWYNAAYSPIRDESGQVIGMLQVAMKQENVDAARQAILRTKVGETGNVDVLGSDGDSQGRYIISRKGERDGENVWNTQSADGSFPIQSLIGKAKSLKFGEVAIEPYLWQDPGDPEPRRKVAAVTQYEPWRWVIVSSIDESEIQAYRLILENGQARMIAVAGAVGLALALIVGFLSLSVARSIARPVTHLADVAAQVSAGNLEAVAKVEQRDEIGTLAAAFNNMTAQLRGMVVTLEDRVQARTDQLRASAEVGRAATSILDPDQLAEQVAGLITARFSYYYAAVFTLNENGQLAVLRAATGEAGRVLLERHHRLPVNRESMVGAAIITQRPRIALDVGEDAVRFASPLLPNTRSEIALPLRMGDRVLGALDVQSEEAGAFDEASAEVLQVMADQIAVALFNAETLNRSEDQARVLGLLNLLSRELAQATTRENVAFAVAQTVMKLIGPDRMALIETTPNLQLLSARTLWADANRPLGVPQPISASGSLSGDCLKRGETIYLPDVTTMLDQYEDVAVVYALGARSSAAIPLRIGDRIIGTFNVASDRADAYTSEQLAQLEQVAAQVALTLDGLNSAKQTQQALAELDAANRRLVGQAWTSYTQSGGLVAAEWRNGQWNTTRQREARAEGAPSQALVSAAQAINLPIKVRGETIGEFSVAPDKGQADWNSDDVAFAQALIDQVGQVLENARLLAETERSAQREKSVADAAEKIHRAADIKTVLQSAISELNRITGRHGISVQLGFGSTVQTDRNGKHTGAEGDR